MILICVQSWNHALKPIPYLSTTHRFTMSPIGYASSTNSSLSKWRSRQQRKPDVPLVAAASNSRKPWWTWRFRPRPTTTKPGGRHDRTPTPIRSTATTAPSTAYASLTRPVRCLRLPLAAVSTAMPTPITTTTTTTTELPISRLRSKRSERFRRPTAFPIRPVSTSWTGEWMTPRYDEPYHPLDRQAVSTITNSPADRRLPRTEGPWSSRARRDVKRNKHSERLTIIPTIITTTIA